MTDTQILQEITPSHSMGCVYSVEREKNSLDFPLHEHPEWEINMLVGCDGARRIVGDSVVTLKNLDLVIIGPGISHAWQQHECRSRSIHEITIQFPQAYFVADYLQRNRLTYMLDFISRATNGVAFGTQAILEIYHHLKTLVRLTDPFERMTQINTIVHAMAMSDDYTMLASPQFTGNEPNISSRRMAAVIKYINEHICENIRVAGLAGIAGMSESAFAHFFRTHANKTVAQYITDVRLNRAAHALTTTSKSVSEICYDCGFINVSHFSKCFRRVKKLTPSEYRKLMNEA